jgi:hypothetical protein
MQSVFPDRPHGRFVRMALLICVAAVTAISSCKKEESGAKPEPSSPKNAALAFARATEADDINGVRAVSIGTDQEYAMLKDFGEMIRAVKRYETAAVKKFGEDGKLPKRMALDMTAEFETADEKITGDTATLVFKSDTIPPRFKKEGEIWKINLDFLDRDAADAEKSKALPAMVHAVDETIKNIDSDKYLTAEEALAALQAQVKNAGHPETAPAQ